MRNRHTLEREVMASRSGSDPMNPWQQADGDRIWVQESRRGQGMEKEYMGTREGEKAIWVESRALHL